MVRDANFAEVVERRGAARSAPPVLDVSPASSASLPALTPTRLVCSCVSSSRNSLTRYSRCEVSDCARSSALVLDVHEFVQLSVCFARRRWSRRASR